MSTQQILFEIPERIRLGLSTGDLQRFGGVIRDIHGRIVCHLKEVGTLKELQNISKNLAKIGEQLAGIQQMQALQLVGMGALAGITLIGFVQVNNKLDRISAQLYDMQGTMAEIKELVKLIHVQHVVNIANEYYRAIASCKENDYEKARAHARNCSADIQNYIENIPIDKLFNDEPTLKFLTKLLVATMQCQILAARQLGMTDISNIMARYKEIFDLLFDKFKNIRKKAMGALPSQPLLSIMNKLGKKDSYIYHLSKAVPICVEYLSNEQHFLKLCPAIGEEKLEEAINKDKKYIVVVDPAYS